MKKVELAFCIILSILVVVPSSAIAININEDPHDGFTGLTNNNNNYSLSVSPSDYISGANFYACGDVAGDGGTDSYGDVSIRKGVGSWIKIGSWSPPQITALPTYTKVCYDITSQVTGADSYTVQWQYTSGSKGLQIDRTWIEKQSGDITSRSASPTTVKPGDTITVTYTIKNTGAISWTGDVTIKADIIGISGEEQNQYPSVPAGGTYSGSFTITIPSGTADGTYQLGLWLYKGINYDKPDDGSSYVEGQDSDSAISTSEGNYIPITVSSQTPLMSDVSQNVDLTTAKRFSFYVENLKWAIAGIRLTDGDDHDVKVDDDPVFGSPTSSTRSGTTSDFVVVNGHKNYGEYYAEVYYNTGSGHYARIEAEDDTTFRLTIGTSKTDTMSTDEVNEMYEVYLDSSKTYTILLDITSGSADLDLFVYDPSTTIKNRNGVDASSTTGGGGQDEQITSYSPTASGYAGIAVIHNGIGSDSATYTLTVSEVINNPPTAYIDTISPNPATYGTSVHFVGHGTDPDGDAIVAYNWRSSIDGNFGTSNDFYYSSLSIGTHTIYFKVKDAKGAWSNEATSTLTITSAGGGGSNPDGDDLTTDEENNLSKVCDRFGLGYCFPDPTKNDAVLPVHAAENHYKARFADFWLRWNDKYKIKDTSDLAYHLIFLAELHKQTGSSTLKAEIAPIMDKIASEIGRRQNTESFNWKGTLLEPHIGKLNLLGYIHQHYSLIYDANYFNDTFEYSNASIPSGTAAMALLLAGRELSNATHLNRGRMATDFIIRWLETRGFDNNLADPFCCYWDSSSPEALNKGGDEYMSTANHYGMSLLAIATTAEVVGGSYSKQVPESDFPSGSYTYAQIASWIVDETRALQDGKAGINLGAIRTGPLIPALLGGRLTEHIQYEGMTSIGVRRAYDVTNDSDAFNVVKNLAGHYWNLYIAKPNITNWWKEWNIDESKPVTCKVENGEKSWASLIELDGSYTYGFRQAVFDMKAPVGTTNETHGAAVMQGDYGSTSFLLTLYQAMIMKDNPYVVFPWEIIFNSRTTEVIYDDCSNLDKSIYQGEKKSFWFWVAGSVDKAFNSVLEYSGSNLTMVLYTPSNQTIDPLVAASDPNIDYIENGPLKYYTIRYPESGLWQVEVNALEAPPEGELFSFKTVYYTGLDFQSYTDTTSYEKGRTVKVYAALLNYSQGLPGAFVTASIKRPDGVSVPLTLYDDGTHGDYNATDGEYTNTFTQTNLGGTYVVTVSAEGNISGEYFERTATGSFEVSAVENVLSAYMTSMIYGKDLNHQRGTTLGVLIYVENDGNTAIDDELWYTIKGPTGEWRYKKWEPIYLEPGEDTFLWFYWDIPEDGPVGFHTFKVEFDDPDIDTLPAVDSFYVVGLNFMLPVATDRKRKKKLKALLLLTIVLGALGCIEEVPRQPQDRETSLPPGISRIDVINEIKNVSKNDSVKFGKEGWLFWIFLGSSGAREKNIIRLASGNLDAIIVDILEGTHFFKFAYMMNGIKITNYSMQEIKDWDIRIDVKDKGEYFIYNITYRRKIQDEKAIKNMISAFKDKRVVSANGTLTYSSGVGWEYNTTTFRILDRVIEINETYNEGECLTCIKYNNRTYIGQDAERIKNAMLDVLLKFYYDEKTYAEIQRGREWGRGVTVEGTRETITLTFDDGSIIEVVYSDDSKLDLGVLKINENTYFFSHYFSEWKRYPPGFDARVFYLAITENVK